MWCIPPSSVFNQRRFPGSGTVSTPAIDSSPFLAGDQSDQVHHSPHPEPVFNTNDQPPTFNTINLTSFYHKNSGPEYQYKNALQIVIHRIIMKLSVVSVIFIVMHLQVSRLDFRPSDQRSDLLELVFATNNEIKICFKDFFLYFLNPCHLCRLKASV